MTSSATHFNLAFAIRSRDIRYSTARIYRITSRVWQLQKDVMKDLYDRMFRLTYNTTMYATGETRSKLFNKSTSFGRNEAWYCMGYGPTSNNQSVAQEFDTGKVHTRLAEHYHGGVVESGREKCSREPEDLFAQYGSYGYNPKARRRAMFLSIKRYWQTGMIAVMRRGENIEYIPVQTRVIRRLSNAARVAIRTETR